MSRCRLDWVRATPAACRARRPWSVGGWGARMSHRRRRRDRAHPVCGDALKFSDDGGDHGALRKLRGRERRRNPPWLDIHAPVARRARESGAPWTWSAMTASGLACGIRRPTNGRATPRPHRSRGRHARVSGSARACWPAARRHDAPESLREGMLRRGRRGARASCNSPTRSIAPSAARRSWDQSDLALCRAHRPQR